MGGFNLRIKVIAFPKIEIKWDWVSNIIFTLSLTQYFDFDNIVMWDLVKHLRIDLQTP